MAVPSQEKEDMRHEKSFLDAPDCESNQKERVISRERENILDGNEMEINEDTSNNNIEVNWRMEGKRKMSSPFCPPMKRADLNGHEELESLRMKFTASSSIATKLHYLHRILEFHQAAFEAQKEDCTGWWRDLYNYGKILLERHLFFERSKSFMDLLRNYKMKVVDGKQFMIPAGFNNVFLDRLWMECLIMEEKYQEAIEIGKEALKQENIEPSIRLRLQILLAGLYRHLGNNERAREYFERVLITCPDNFDVQDHLFGSMTGLCSPVERKEFSLKNPNVCLFRFDRDQVYLGIEEAYTSGDYKKCVHLSKSALKTFIGDEWILVYLVSSFSCLGRDSHPELYNLGQKFVTERPHSTLTWYTIGCYYQVIGKSDEARRYFFKACTPKSHQGRNLILGTVDYVIAAAWIALGHSFAAIGDHDQAVSAYMTVVRQHAPGTITPLILLAIEYLRVRQPGVATAFLADAIANEPDNPLVLNELAILQYGKGSYETAEKIICKGLMNATGLIKCTLIVNAVITRIKRFTTGLSGLDSLIEMIEDCRRYLEPIYPTCKDAINSQDPFIQYLNPAVRSLASDSSMNLFSWNGVSPTGNLTLPLQVILLNSMIEEYATMLSIARNESEEEMNRNLDISTNGFDTVLQALQEKSSNSIWIEVVRERHDRLLQLALLYQSKSVKESEPVIGQFNAATPDYAHRVKKECDTSMMSITSAGSSTSFIDGSPHITRAASRPPMTANLQSNTSVMPSFNGNSSMTIVGAAANSNASANASFLANISVNLSRRRVSLRRQMTGLRFDLADPANPVINASFTSSSSSAMANSSNSASLLNTSSMSLSSTTNSAGNVLLTSMLDLTSMDPSILGGDPESIRPGNLFRRTSSSLMAQSVSSAEVAEAWTRQSSRNSVLQEDSGDIDETNLEDMVND